VGVLEFAKRRLLVRAKQQVWHASSSSDLAVAANSLRAQHLQAPRYMSLQPLGLLFTCCAARVQTLL
jgi:hypothetical protein